MPAVGRTHFFLNLSKINGFSDFIFHFFAKWGKNGENYIFYITKLKDGIGQISCWYDYSINHS